MKDTPLFPCSTHTQDITSVHSLKKTGEKKKGGGWEKELKQGQFYFGGGGGGKRDVDIQW